MSNKLKDYVKAKEYCDRVNPENEIQQQTYDRCEAIIKQFEDALPIGSGIVSTEVISVTNKKIVISFDYQHLNENGYYDGWTHHEARITATFGGYTMYISGRNRNDIKPYLHELFSCHISKFI